LAIACRRDSGILDRGGPNGGDERFWVYAWYSQLKDEPKWKALIDRIDAARRDRSAGTQGV
jgi:hypothetical protein